LLQNIITLSTPVFENR